MAEIDLSRGHECSPERTRHAAELWANLSGLLAFFVGRGRGLGGPQDLRHVMVQLREVAMQINVLCLAGRNWTLREIAEGNANVASGEMTAVAASATTAALDGICQAAEYLYLAANVAEETFRHLDKRPATMIGKARRKRQIAE